ncbi:MAG TPA: BlaI/MecI/CopY family transcriptional regulator [Blastocatellia bacterium]|nr:BlaI/MecI/CopY family transcriptional regulator [Blastocatellia bacterium]
MASEKAVKLTRFEMEIMNSIWELGRASVREIHEQLPEKKRAAYTTVQTIVRRLEEKGAVRRVRKIGNAIIFEPVVSRTATHHKLILDLLELFGGSARPLMAHLAEAGKLSLEDLREMETLLGEQAEDGQTTGKDVQRPGSTSRARRD